MFKTMFSTLRNNHVKFFQKNSKMAAEKFIDY